MFEFRNRGIFYEAVTNQILDDLVAACQPRRMTVVGDFSLRGGISTIVTATTGSRTPTSARPMHPSTERREPSTILRSIEDSLDLHAFAPRDITSVVEEFVSAAAGAGRREVRLIHGRGKGVQRGMVQAVTRTPSAGRGVLGCAGEPSRRHGREPENRRAGRIQEPVASQRSGRPDPPRPGRELLPHRWAAGGR